MNPNPSIKEHVQEKLKAVNREGYERRSGVAGGFPVMSVDQATEAILKIIESEVIGENQEHAPVETLGIWSHDIAKFEYNHLRESQREKLK